MLYTLKERYVEFMNKISEWSLQNTKEQLDLEIINLFKNSRLFGFHSPVAFGGHGKDFVYHSVAIQEIATNNPKLALSIINNYLCEQVLLKFGSKEQIIKYVNSLKAAEKFAYLPLFETTNFTVDSTDFSFRKNTIHYQISGSKKLKTDLTNIDFIIIFAQSIEDDKLSTFILDKDDFTFEDEKLTIDGTFDNSHLLGNMDDGLSVIKYALVQSHLSIASYHFALANKFFNIMLENISSVEDVNKLDKISKLAGDLEATKLLIYKTCELKSNGFNTIKRGVFSKEHAASALELAIELFIQTGNEFIDPKDYLLFGNIFSRDLENKAQLVLSSLIEKKNSSSEEVKIFEDDRVERKGIIFEFNNTEINTNELFEAIKGYLPSCNSSTDIYGPIESAKVGIGFGLGIGDRENIVNVEKLASKTCGVVTCTLPIAEELEWLDRNRIVGISGNNFYGDIYFALGMSGANQHIESLKKAKIVVAINADKHAKIFSNCDYGIVGDMNEILPILCKKIDLYNNQK